MGKLQWKKRQKTHTDSSAFRGFKLTPRINAAGYRSSPWLRYKEKHTKKPLKLRAFRETKVQISGLKPHLFWRVLGGQFISSCPKQYLYPFR
jgi:hypothetical protein